MRHGRRAGCAARRAAAATFALKLLCAGAGLVCNEAAAQGYFRAGVGVALEAGAGFTDVDCRAAMPAALYGCEAGGDGAALRSAGAFGHSGGLEIGAGYAFSSALRMEFRMAYRPAAGFEGRANFLAPEQEQSVRTERSSLSGVVGVEFDLASLGVPAPAGFRPFAGAGIGRVRHRLDETRMRFPRTETLVPGASNMDWMWTVTAGISRALSERTVLDVAWRYVDQGDVMTGEGAGRVQWRDGSRTVALDLAPTRAQVNHHDIVLSVRYRW